MPSRTLLRAVTALPLLFATTLLSAAVPSRIRTLSSESGRAEVPHSIPGRARVANDVGEASSTTRLPDVTLHFSLTAAQQTSLSQLLLDQQNPGSPRYHQWLTPQQFGAQFGLSPADLNAVKSWLAAQGFTDVRVAPSNNLVSFSGTVAQLERSLGLSMHSVVLDGEPHLTNISNPKLPSGLAAVVSGITGLNDFRLKPRVRLRPRFTSSVSGDHFLAPGDLYSIYDMSPLLSASINGSGVSIAVVGQTDISPTDVAAFRSASGLSSNLPATVLAGPDPGTSSDSGEIAEAHLDVEWAGAIAPSASIQYVNSTDVLNISLPYAITNNVAPIISISYGLCEQDSDAATLDSINVLFQQANAQGQTIVGPGGDSGATDCDYLSASAADGLAVDFPASSPFVTGMGGTTFNEGSGTYWSSSNNSNGGSANGYIPEVVWNDSSTSGLSSTGGGRSIFFAKPSWQTGNGVPNDFSRDVPDISFAASPNHDGYLLCASGSCTSGFRSGNSTGTLNVVGGTSVSVPLFAGVLALLEQKLGTRVGNVNPVLYGFANSTYAATVFHDITSGNNNSSCIQGSLDCSSGTSIGYSAGSGYDLTTGWGSVDVFNLVNQWSLVTPAGSTAGSGSVISATAITSTAPTCGVSSGSMALTISVANDSGTANTAVPGGSVQILIDNTVIGTALALSNGSVPYTLNTATLSSGQHTVSASYSGDTTYAGSKGTLSIDVVSASSPDFSITPCTSSVSITSGATATGVTYTVTPFNGFTGPVAFSVSADASLAATYAFSVTPVVVSSASPGSTVLTLTASQTSTGAVRRPTAQAKPESLGARGTGLYAAGSGVTVAALLLITLPKRRRMGALLAAFVSVAALTSLGCGSSGTATTTVNGGGGGGTTTPVTTNTVPNTYYVTVTGIGTSSTGATLVHSARLQFVVTAK